MFVMEFNNYSIAEDESTSLISLLQETPYVAGKSVYGILEMRHVVYFFLVLVGIVLYPR